MLKTLPAFGVYHCVNSGHATWLEVGQAIARRLGKDDRLLKPVSVNDVRLRASRPQYAALDNGKLAGTGFTMPAWRDAIDRYLSTMAPA
jgi:dTDP-4-dehydrorhamnose reductase